MNQNEGTENEPPAGDDVNNVERQVPKVRYIFVLAIVSTYVASFMLLIAGAVQTARIVYELIFGHSMSINREKFEFLEVIDVFLVATILYVIASGFYQLFLNAKTPFDPWLRVKSVADLEAKLTGVVITVMGVTALGRVVAWDGQSDLLPFGVTVALLIAALSFFLYTHSKQH
jgi:uncharacterized membrane protein YqhA